jgi:hypothetical protein
MSGRREDSGVRGTLVLLGAGLVMVVCCAGPLLVAGGALGAVGGALRNPGLITVGALMALIAIAYALNCRTRRRRGAGPEDCCSSVPLPTGVGDDSERNGTGPGDAPQREGVQVEQPTPSRRSEEY